MRIPAIRATVLAPLLALTTSVPATAQLPLEPGHIVVTCDLSFPSPYVLGIIDVRDPGCDPTAVLGMNWAPPMYHNEMPNPTGNPADEWTFANLGHAVAISDHGDPLA